KLHIIAASAAFTFFLVSVSNYAYAHSAIDGEATVKNVDKYQIAFQQYPTIASTGENATLHFSILDRDRSSVQGVYAAMMMKEKDSGKVVEQVPYRFYEVGDISIPYKFNDSEDYVATLVARTNEEPSKPLRADFDIPVGQTMSSSELLFMAVPFAAALAGGIVFLLRRK
ncbi:MAG: hypothetical protein AB1351_11205, partial [Thermoproteota archaeon]